MADTAAHPSLLERAKEWMRHEAHAHNAKQLVVDLVAKVHELEVKAEELPALRRRLDALEALVAKDSPACAHAAETAEGGAEKAAGTP